MNHPTIDYYNNNAENFIAGTVDVNFEKTQNRFLEKLPKGAEILDFGCGSGRDTKYFLEKGYSVEAIDGSEELCKYASELTGITVKNMLFQELDAVEKYDGIWACSSILHLQKDVLKDVLVKMVRALKADGYIYTSFKHSEFEGIRNGRYFTDFTLDSFQVFLRSIDNKTFDNEKIKDQKTGSSLLIDENWITGDVRPGRDEEKWLNLILKKDDSET